MTEGALKAVGFLNKPVGGGAWVLFLDWLI